LKKTLLKALSRKKKPTTRRSSGLHRKIRTPGKNSNTRAEENNSSKTTTFKKDVTPSRKDPGAADIITSPEEVDSITSPEEAVSITSPEEEDSMSQEEATTSKVAIMNLESVASPEITMITESRPSKAQEKE